MVPAPVQDLISLKGIPRAGEPSTVPWGPVTATGGFVEGDKYRFYSSKATHDGDDKFQTLDEGTNIDNFVIRLPKNRITLDSIPTGLDEDIQVDEKDGLATWMTNLDGKGTLSLSLKPNPDPEKGMDIVAFNFHFESLWNVTFSSSSGALQFSFGSYLQDPLGNFKVPVPGLEEDGDMLYFGLDPKKTPSDLNSTVKGLFDFSGTFATPPSLIADWKATLKLQSPKSAEKSDDTGAGGKRNGLWISPSTALQTTVRLQFGLGGEDATTFNNAIAGTLKNFKIDTLDVVCKKTLVLAETDAGNKAVTEGSVMFQAQCKIQPQGLPEVSVVASISFYAYSYSIVVQLNSKDAFQGILVWLTDLVPGLDLSFIRQFLVDSNIFKDHGVYPRQITVNLDCDDKGKNTSLASFSFDIEVNAKFGEDPTTAGSPATPVFLITYAWMSGGPNWGSIQGQLWNWYDTSTMRDLQPEYEITASLEPLTENPAKALNLLKMIPDVDIDHVPTTIPTQISRAYITLSGSGVTLGGTVKSIAFESDDPPPVPQLDLGILNIDAGFAWGKQKEFTLAVSFLAEMRPSPTSVHQETAVLMGGLAYSSRDSKWELKASLESLYASTLYEFFKESTADHVMPLIESIQVQSLDLEYHYATRKNDKGDDETVGSAFKFQGVLLAAGLELTLHFNYLTGGGFTFVATLNSSKKKATISDVIKGILGDDGLELPSFLDEITFGNNKSEDKPDNSPDASPTKKGSFQFVATVAVGKLKFAFVQLHRDEWVPKTPSKRFFKASLTALPEIDIPLVGNLTQPFDEMYFMWIQDATGQNKNKDPGLTRLDVKSLDKSLPLVTKDKFKDPREDDLLMGTGSHFGVIIKNSEGNPTCILDYDFKKKASSKPTQSTGDEKSGPASLAVVPAEKSGSGAPTPEKEDSDGGSASAPFKKKAGPLSISNISLKYVDKILHIGFNATFELGPLGFSLLGFTINLELTSLDISKIKFPTFSLEGFSVAFEKPPLTIAGIVRHGKSADLNYYAGGLIVGWVPYQLQAAGFYGEATPEGRDKFTSVFVFARLDGPLVTLEFAEISGVTGGFGYKSEVRIPKANEITDFPFISQSQLDGASGSALDALERLTSPDSAAGGWFKPQDDSYWAAAGMKIDAFQMISLDAVMVVMFGQSVKLGIYAVALVDIPTAKSPVKFAHVELGIGVTVDFDYGTMKVEGQLSPKSYILDPNCHLTGGFALYYWFDAPHADKSNAYFAITPKVCMGGGRLHAAFSAGPITAWFDAFANFLINYKPFNFTSSAGICVGVRFDIDFLFIHTHISVEISADLYLWGPPLAGRVHIDIKVAKFNINFGAGKSDVQAVDILEFYHLVLQASSQQKKSVTAEAEKSMVAEKDENILTQEMNQGHTLLATSGLLNNASSPQRTQNEDWVVRGGSFSFVVGCKMAVQYAEQVDENDKMVNSISSMADSIFAKPMQLTEAMSKSEMKIEILQDGVARDKWGMTQEYKLVPTGLWAKYDQENDPTKSKDGNNVDDLLDNDKGSVKLMMGILMQAPPAIMSIDTLKAFDILDAGLEELDAKKNFPDPEESKEDWAPDTPQEGAGQWKTVREKWELPEWNADEEHQKEPEDVQTAFVKTWADLFHWDSTLSTLAKIPKLLDKRFDDLYVGAPLTTV
ncbi:hypothetical protein EDB80DRAFT_842092 [Ilyonectria destructans]|nr:hypothetical protein EDB80DRAFT_842092 [Ilyonectria destructans]